MVELANATTKLARMVGTIRFPIPALGAPFGSAIGLALKDCSAVEGLKAGAVGVLVGGCPRSNFKVVIATMSAPGRWFFDRFAPRRQRDHGRIALNGYECP